MSSPATAAFLTAWRSLQASRALLVKLELTNPSAATLYFASRDVVTPGGQLWEPLVIDAEDITDSTDLLSAGPDPASTSVILARRRLNSQTSGDVSNLLDGYYVEGATVTLYLWEASLTSLTDALQVYKGIVNRYSVTEFAVTLQLVQRRAWNVRIPPKTVDKISYPYCPDTSAGLPLPIVIGSFRAFPMRAPWGASAGYGSYNDDRDDSGGAAGVIPGILVDPGAGDDKVKVVYSGHQLSVIYDRDGSDGGYPHYIDGGEHLSPLDVAGLTFARNTGESYMTIDDGTLMSYVAVLPNDVRTGSGKNSAANPRNAMDVTNETSYATIDGSASQTALQLTLPSGNVPGKISSVEVVVGYSGNASNNSTLLVLPVNQSSGSGTAVQSTLGDAQATTPRVLRGTWDANWYNPDTGSFGGFGTGTYSSVDVRVAFTVAGNNKARVYWVALVVKYRPNRSLISPAQTRPEKFGEAWARVYPGRTNPARFLNNVNTRFTLTTSPAVYEFTSSFYANVRGQADTSPATYTSSASALITVPCDIARYLLCAYGGENAASSFEVGATEFGSLVYARTLLGVMNSMSCYIGQRTSLQKILQGVAVQSASHLFLDRFDDKWRWLVWNTGLAADYDLALGWSDVFDFSAGLGSNTESVQAVSVQYGHDYAKNRTLFTALVRPDNSAQGFSQPDVRDTTREAQAAASTAAWGVSNELTVAAEYLRDETEAVWLRNRLFDLQKSPPVYVRFSTLKCPDLQRGRVFSLSSDIDSHVRYPGPGSNGSWAGRKFRVLEVQQRLMAAWHQEVVAVEV